MPPNTLIPKLRPLTPVESQASFDSWREGMIWQISLDPQSARFLTDLKTWDNSEHRGFKNDPAEFDKDTKMTAIAKEMLLNIVLGSIASNATVISPKYIKKVATSLDEIWERLRSYYGFRKTGGRITEFFDFTLEANESREALYERMYTYLEDNLLTKDGSVEHEGSKPTKDEELTPTLLNILVVNWLRTIHPSLPHAVKQKFPTQLRSSTIFSIRSEISDAIPSILEEIEEKASISRLGKYSNNNFRNKPKKRSKFCCLCKSAGRYCEGHYLSKCPFLPESDKHYFSKTREIFVESDNESDNDLDPNSATGSRVVCSHIPTSRRVDILPSPVIKVSVGNLESAMLLDSGAEASLIEATHCRQIGVKITPTSQRAVLADGTTSMKTIGEARFPIKFGHHTFDFSGLVVEQLDTPIIAGVPFLEKHDIYVRPSTKTAYISDCCSYKYLGTEPVISKDNLYKPSILRVSSKACLLPGQSINLPIPDELIHEEYLALEPRPKCLPKDSPEWLPCSIVKVTNGSIELVNTLQEPIMINKHSQALQVRPTYFMNEANRSNDVHITEIKSHPVPDVNHHEMIEIDPSSKTLSKSEREEFQNVHYEFKNLFSPGIGCYNGYSGDYKHIITMSSALPPQRRGRVPMYNRHDLHTLQQKCDELLEQGVFCRSEDVGISITHCNPSFLVKKSSGGTRLVTSFGSVAEYALVPPTKTTDVQEVLRHVGQWQYLIKTDLKSAYYQIPLHEDSMRYVGVNTPFKGTYVYQRSVMGLPGSEAALEEVLCRILGDLVQKGSVIKLVDDLYLGAKTVSDLVDLWKSVLTKLQFNGLKLSPEKTVICPTSTVILGWLWESGSIRPTPHRLNTLSACETPKTVKGLRSFIGCYKFLSRSLPFYADILHPLEIACSSRQSSENILWDDTLMNAFNKAKNHLKSAKTIVLPTYKDTLHIVTDAAVRNAGIASALYVLRNGKPRLAGYFNAKLSKNQREWLPCEVEALSIGASIKHFSPYILQSDHKTRVLTDSKPCVEAYKKLLRGEFSVSPRLTTYLSIVSRFKIEVMHISGKDNIFADFSSRNPIECKGPCQVCTFINKLESCVVGQVQINDILSGKCRIPFSSRTSWLEIQKDDTDLMKVKEYLSEGLTPSRKKTSKDILRYMNCVSLSETPNDGLIVVKESLPFQKQNQRIVIPRHIAPGLITALHLELNHPSVYQLQLAFTRSFFTLDMHKIVLDVVNSCHACASLKKLPSLFKNQTTSTNINTIGSVFSADVLKDYGQLILVLRESISSYTVATFIPDEKSTSLRDGLITLTSQLRSPVSQSAVIRTDPASGLRGLINDKILQSHNLSVELGDAKNPNKNPVAEKAIEELRQEIVRLQPLGGKLNPATLAVSLSHLNSRIRNNKLSALEIWTQRTMSTGDQLSYDDKEIIQSKIQQRLKNHTSSAKFKSRGKTTEIVPNVKKGNIVYLYSDKSKSHARNKYLVVDVEEEFVIIQKFVNTQLRSRKYRVRKSDVIIVSPNSNVSNKNESSTSETEEEESPKFSDYLKVYHKPTEYRDPQEGLRRSTRQRKTPSRFRDYDCSSDSASYTSVDTTDEPYVPSRTFTRKKQNSI